jgi:drug/metabolite transporter (DMT)-like permease
VESISRREFKNHSGGSACFVQTNTHLPTHLLFPLTSSITYVFAVMLLKRMGSWGVDMWRITFVSNLALGLAFAPCWLMGGEVRSPSVFWQPLAAAGLFLAGQVCSFLALQYGDVSVGTPVLGLKIVLVALGSSFLLNAPVPIACWIAAVLSTFAIALLARGKSRPRHALGLTVLAASLAAASFALFDVLVQKWSPEWGVGKFLPLVFGTLAVLSFGVVPLFAAPLHTVPQKAWGCLVGGSVLLALQALLFVYAVGAFGDATAMNIVYSARGLWSVLIVWLLGHWFANEEQMLPLSLLRSRMAGAALMLVAIILVVIS